MRTAHEQPTAAHRRALVRQRGANSMSIHEHGTRITYGHTPSGRPHKYTYTSNLRQYTVELTARVHMSRAHEQPTAAHCRALVTHRRATRTSTHEHITRRTYGCIQKGGPHEYIWEQRTSNLRLHTVVPSLHIVWPTTQIQTSTLHESTAVYRRADRTNTHENSTRATYGCTP